MPQNTWEESAGALIYHGIELKRGINAKDHIQRAKLRIIELECLCDISAAEKKSRMTMEEAFLIVYNKLPYGKFSGTQLAKRAIFLTGRMDAHKDSVLRPLRRLRKNEKINCPNIGAPKNSIYEKKRLEETAIQDELKFR